MEDFLREIKLYDLLKNNKFLYIGGSLPSYIRCPNFDKKKIMDVVDDIDIYTKNTELLYVFGKNSGLFEKNFEYKTTISIKFNNVKLHFITPYFDNFKKDILDTCDTTLVGVGYHPATSQYIYSDKYIKSLSKKCFIITDKNFTTKRRNKLISRIKKWYEFDYVECKGPEYNFDLYASSTSYLNITNCIILPKYTQIFGNKFDCLYCIKTLSSNLICKKCIRIIYLFSENKIRNKYIFILGGFSGLGSHIRQKLNCSSNHITFTSSQNRKGSIKYNLYDGEYNLITSDDINTLKYNICNNTDIYILNAFKTTSDYDDSWNTTILNFDRDILEDRLHCNVFGYVNFVRNLIKTRSISIKNKPVVLVFMDANESKYKNKMVDGKHLEINMVKSAVKQIFYSNSKLLASLNIITICYDPGWLSSENIKMSKKDSILIDTDISINGLFYFINETMANFQNLMNKKIYIFDRSVYNYIDRVKYLNIRLFNDIFYNAKIDKYIYDVINDYL